MQFTITIPRGWGHPKYTLGQRTEQGMIIGFEFIPDSSLIANEGVKGWQYALLPSNKSADIVYLPEKEVKPLSAKESKEEILNEIDEHLNQVAILQAQLETDLDIRTPFGNVKPTTAKPVHRQSISRRSAA